MSIGCRYILPAAVTKLNATHFTGQTCSANSHCPAPISPQPHQALPDMHTEVPYHLVKLPSKLPTRNTGTRTGARLDLRTCRTAPQLAEEGWKLALEAWMR